MIREAIIKIKLHNKLILIRINNWPSFFMGGETIFT